MQQQVSVVLLAMLIASTSAMNFQKRQLVNNAQQMAALLPESQQLPGVQNNMPSGLLDTAQPTEEPLDSDAQVVPDVDSDEDVDDSYAIITDEPSAQAVASSSLKSSPIVVASNAASQLVPSSSASMFMQPYDYDWFYPEDVQVFNGVRGFDYGYSLADDSQAALNSTSSNSVIKVAVLSNVFYFTKATTLIEEVESLLAYEEKLFGSASFQQYLEQTNDYEFFNLVGAPPASSSTPSAPAGVANNKISS